MNSKAKGWIGVDLDGTLAEYDVWRGIQHIGQPIEPMKRRVLKWLVEGKEVRIFTARAYMPPMNLDDVATMNQRDSAGEAIMYIKRWCKMHIGQVLEVTCQKDYGMIELWDDRAVQVIPNTGLRADGAVE
jgi:hypothetical protein